MNAKDTLKKIAEALNIVTSPVEKVEETPVKEAQTVEAPIEEAPVVEEKAEQATEVKTEEAAPADEPVKEEAAEEVVESTEVVEDEKQDDTPEVVESKDEVIDPARVKELENQIDSLKEILKNAMSQPEETPELPKEEEGLTHSPEKQVASKKAKGIGNKGNDIMDRVFKYMNNNN